MTAQVRWIDSPIVFGARPIWATYHDKMTDLSDLWVREMDPENETGAVVTGFFTASKIPALDDQMREAFNVGFELDGIAVETVEGIAYHRRAAVIRMWGADEIDRIESDMMEADND